MPQAWTLMRTCPSPGFGTSLSTISKGPIALETWTERIFLLLFFHYRIAEILKGTMDIKNMQRSLVEARQMLVSVEEDVIHIRNSFH
jgi:hypothetical protein